MGEYPTQEELKELKEIANKIPLNVSLIEEIVSEIWKYYKEGTWYTSTDDEWTLQLHTGGWSGNEEIVDTLSETMFWVMFWQKTERGGHFYFKGQFIKETTDERT